ncbi:hypothetical protein FPK72_27995, partial [Acinetobacter baumannii]|nr:hypothetical protein [Acinetobacter baumannii]
MGSQVWVVSTLLISIVLIILTIVKLKFHPFLALLLANTLTLSLLFYERMSSARSVMLGNLASDVATSVA